MVPAQIQDLMLAAMPLAEIQIVDYFEATKIWHIAADEKSEIFGELDETRKVLVLSMPLERPTVMTQPVLDLALRFGHVWDVSGGFRVTLESSEGPFWLVLDLGLGGLETDTLARLLREMVSKGSAWREIILHPPGHDGDSDNLKMLSEAGVLRA
jgi:hypothetical protein